MQPAQDGTEPFGEHKLHGVGFLRLAAGIRTMPDARRSYQALRRENLSACENEHARHWAGHVADQTKFRS
jgi:hypothetical protein